VNESELRRIVQNCLAEMHDGLKKPTHDTRADPTRAANLFLRAIERAGLKVIDVRDEPVDDWFRPVP
jgi:uncharacterized ferritin-like protein (DUF455 family)